MYSLREMICDLRSDFRRYRELFRPAPAGRQAGVLRVLMGSPGLFVVGGYRVRFWLRDRCLATGSIPLRCVLKALNWLVPIFYVYVMKTDIAHWPVIGAGLYLSNRGGITLGARRVGSGCVIHHNVTIGMDRKKTLPEIGDNVWIGPDTVLYGKSIGSGVVVRAESVLGKSVPARCVVEGKGGRIVERDFDNSRYLASSDPCVARAPADAGDADGAAAASDVGDTDNMGKKDV